MTVSPIRHGRDSRRATSATHPAFVLGPRPTPPDDTGCGGPHGWALEAGRHLHGAAGAVLAASALPDLSRAEWSSVLCELEQHLMAGTLDGLGWIRVARMVTDPDSAVMLPPSAAHRWAERLAEEAARSIDAAYVTRAYAAGVLLDDPYLGCSVRSAVDAVIPASRGHAATTATAWATARERRGPDRRGDRCTSGCPVWYGFRQLAAVPRLNAV